MPPQNIEAEQAVLGSMLLDDTAVHLAMDMLTPESFYRTSHREIFNAMVSLFERSEAIDFVTVSAELRRMKVYEKIGAADYIKWLIDGVATTANIEFYASIVRDRALVRELINVSQRIVSESFEEEENAQELLDRAEQQVFDIRRKSTTDGFKALSGMIED
ncbi:MAG: replicative DNA helicase, partial [Elusimicrobia bacterium]|nr:replicative DNA helicase [Elusimicrobiota bacterium]